MFLALDFLIMPETYNFSGDVTTILGLVGVLSTGIIVVTAFRRFYNSPYNYRVKVQQPQTEIVPDDELAQPPLQNP
ncbi:hypothetical protein SWPG_00183 [Synechococcus phage S-CBM2]|nr:hypothetical protein SWPG_00183 [Synechococcus phage S-CBM2]